MDGKLPCLGQVRLRRMGHLEAWIYPDQWETATDPDYKRF